MKKYHLAQLNIARAKTASLYSPQLQGFFDRLDEINNLAEQQPGYVWRFTESPNETPVAISVFKDKRLAVNMSVWEDVATLKNFTYRTAHAELIRSKKLWFEHLDKAFYVLWWIEAGHIPTIEEAKARLDLLDKKGATAEAFTFKKIFEAPS